jgi:cytoskeletal protein CcmA (bactofilin family)
VGIKDFFGFEKPTENQDGSGAPGGEHSTSGVERLTEETSEWAQPDYEPEYETVPAAAAEESSSIVVLDEIPAAAEEYVSGADTDGAYDEDPKEEMSISLIAKEAFVTGDIMTQGHIDIVGKVNGDVEAKGNVAVQGVIKGNVAGEKIGLYECRIKGDLKANTGVVADSRSTVIGDIETKNIILDGKLKGDINAENVVVLRSNAYYVGDLITESLAIEAGAVINGNVRMLVDGDPDAPFEE